MIEDLFPAEVVTVAGAADRWRGKPYPEEVLCIRRAVPKRRQEFIAGRLCAREALRQLGTRNWPLLVGTQREPLWPPDIVGSLSHCDGFCAVAVARRCHIRGIGLDIEIAAPLGPDLVSLICTPAEVAWSCATPSPSYCDWQKVIFSAKESVYKCYFPITRRFIDFHDAEIQIIPQSGQFSVSFSANATVPFSDNSILQGRFAINHTYIFTAVTLTASERDPKA